MKKLFVLFISLTCTYITFAQDSTVVNPVSDTLPEAVIDTLPITDPNDLIE